MTKALLFKTWFGAFLVGLTLFMQGCLGVSQPTETQIQEMSQNFFNQEYQGLFLAENVVKKNGYKKNDTSYVAEVTVMGRAQLSLEDFAKSTMSDPEVSGMEKMANTLKIGMMTMTLPAFEAGDVLEFEREYLFIKTDNGWQIKEQLNASAH
ncbi:hypothetical protein [Thiomicrorhabdus indica]|uniref:hypothetical protein n=1 Tax=Thiomicrorhabdus indica TaxID=2267253 RepID=UPI00102D70FE|nr:hypothetical protein [Thiomicrorhabdus indica]